MMVKKNITKKLTFLGIGLAWAFSALGEPATSTNKSANATKRLVELHETKIDHKFLEKMEGTSLKGYVPLPDKTYSGVTIASGFDLGQLSLKEFEDLPIEKSLKNKLRPYVGLKKYEAVDYLKKYPLTITMEESRQLNIIAAHMILQPLVKVYDQASPKSFIELPAQAQTVIFSFAYQHGSAFMTKSKSKELWQYFVTHDWENAGKVLRSHQMYINRRNSEAALLDQLA